jgi:predicted nucleotidyltransferase component of viral defense system
VNQFSDLLAIAKNEAQRTGVDVNTALKEILHYDILYAISESSLNQDLVFQGGTSLRMCYQGNRYSEDLDFVAGKPEILDKMDSFKQLLIDTVEQRYNLEVSFKDPKPEAFDRKPVSVARWTAVVHVPQEEKCKTQTQKIKIEVADVPSHENHGVMLSQHYERLAPGYSNIMLRVSTLNEILADKIVAVAGRKFIKPRDIWDIQWLTARNITPDMGMVRKKLADYGEAGNFEERISTRSAELCTSDFVKTFEAEMSRFVPAEMQRRFQTHPDFSSRLSESVSRVLVDALDQYRGKKVAVSSFDMGI